MTDEEALALLNRIDAEGGLSVRSRSWEDTFAGDVYFDAPCGYTVVVFNDCDEWDYIDHIEDSAGVPVWEGWEPLGEEKRPSTWAVLYWTPKDESAWRNAPVRADRLEAGSARTDDRESGNPDK